MFSRCTQVELEDMLNMQARQLARLHRILQLLPILLLLAHNLFLDHTHQTHQDRTLNLDRTHQTHQDRTLNLDHTHQDRTLNLDRTHQTHQDRTLHLDRTLQIHLDHTLLQCIRPRTLQRHLLLHPTLKCHHQRNHLRQRMHQRHTPCQVSHKFFLFLITCLIFSLLRSSKSLM
jgi:hypothetical protein